MKHAVYSDGRRDGRAMPSYMGRPIAPVVPCNEQNVFWLSRNERWSEEQPERILDVLAIQPGMVVADVGAGTGFLTVPLAHRVGQSGLVVATDLQSEMLDTLLSRPDLPKNVHAVLATPTNPNLPPNQFDLVLLVDAYHEAPYPALLLRGIRRALKSNGRLVIVEYRQEDRRVPIHPLHRMSTQQVLLELGTNRFQLIQQYEHLPWQHLFIFMKR